VFSYEKSTSSWLLVLFVFVTHTPGAIGPTTTTDLVVRKFEISGKAKKCNPRPRRSLSAMSSFTTRVELHDADWADYDLLHKKMVAQGFSRTITSDDGKRYQLPPAEYNYEGSGTRADVLAKARAAASQVKQSYAVFVTESAGRTWSGLQAA
jgi:hypothetical protein